MQGDKNRYVQREGKYSQRIILDSDVYLKKGISLFGQTEVVRKKDGSLVIRCYKSKGRVIAGVVSDYIWAALTALGDADTRMPFNDWKELYHADMVLLGRYKGDLECRLSYQEFRIEVMKCVFVFIKPKESGSSKDSIQKRWGRQ